MAIFVDILLAKNEEVPSPELLHLAFFSAFQNVENHRQLFKFPNLSCTLNIFVRVLCYDLISFGFSCTYRTDCIS